jgi:hypothetical protein
MGVVAPRPYSGRWKWCRQDPALVGGNSGARNGSSRWKWWRQDPIPDGEMVVPGTALAGGKGGARTRLQPVETLALGPSFGRVNSGTRTQLWPRKQQHKDPTPASGNGGAQGPDPTGGKEGARIRTQVG